MHDHHHHHHHHELDPQNINNAFWLGVALNLAFVFIELFAGWYYESIALFSDAGHNLSDVASLLIALLAFRLLKVAPSMTYTYGYRKTSVMAALINSVILLVAVVVILWESISRFWSVPSTSGLGVGIVAGIGIIVNSLTAWLFHSGKDHDLNVKGAYLHMVADALVSLGVVIGGVVIYFTNWYWVDPVIGIVIAVIIFLSSWKLMLDSLRLALDGVPEDADPHKIEHALKHIEGVVSVHHLHVWAISTTENAFTAHVVVKKNLDFSDLPALKKEIKHVLVHEGIQHSTIEIEREGDECDALSCVILQTKEHHHHDHEDHDHHHDHHDNHHGHNHDHHH